jgi:hypothetical protein
MYEYSYSDANKVPTSNYRFKKHCGREYSDDEESNLYNSYQMEDCYDSECDNDRMQYTAGNSYVVPYSKRSSKYYNKDWTEWRGDKPEHQKEWPSSMYFGEQLRSEEVYQGAHAATSDEFWGKEDVWDYYQNYVGTNHQDIYDAVVDVPLERAKSKRASASPYCVDPDAKHEHEYDADIAEGCLYTRSDDVLTMSGRDRYVRMPVKTLPGVNFQAPRSDRNMGGTPVIEYFRGPRLPTDQVVRDDLPTGAPTDAPPVKPNHDLTPSIRQTKFAWMGVMGELDGGFNSTGESICRNDASRGMALRKQMKLPLFNGPVQPGATGVGDSICTNEVGGERVRNVDTHMSMWGSAPKSDNPLQGWIGIQDDVSKGGRIKHANPFISMWGSAPKSSNPGEGAGDDRISDSVKEGRIRNVDTHMSMWGSAPKSDNPLNGWDCMADDMMSGGRIKYIYNIPIPGANPGVPNGTGDDICVNDPINGARIPDKGTMTVEGNYKPVQVPNADYGPLGVNQAVPESLGRRAPTIPFLGGMSSSTGKFDGFFSLGQLFAHVRPDWESIGGMAGSSSAPPIMSTCNLTNTRINKPISTEPDCTLMKGVMKGLGSKTICDMANIEAFDDLAPIVW